MSFCGGTGSVGRGVVIWRAVVSLHPPETVPSSGDEALTRVGSDEALARVGSDEALAWVGSDGEGRVPAGGEVFS